MIELYSVAASSLKPSSGLLVRTQKVGRRTVNVIPVGAIISVSMRSAAALELA